MSFFGNRLKEERKRLGLNQAQLAAFGGVQITAQANYEKGLRKPDSDYLIGVAAIGVDVLYILTGQRTGEPEPLTQEESALLKNFRDLSETGKEAVKTTTRALSQQKGNQADVA